jgi:hypothetical protein
MKSIELISMHYTIYQTTNLLNNKIYIGAHETGEVIRFEGTKALIAAGFNSGHVSNCIQGKGSGKDKNQHKGYIWTRE